MTALSADYPRSSPQDDLFGHARFPENLSIKNITDRCQPEKLMASIVTCEESHETK